MSNILCILHVGECVCVHRCPFMLIPLMLFFKILLLFFLAVLGLPCPVQAFSRCGEPGATL